MLRRNPNGGSADIEYSGSNITHRSFLDDIPDPIDVERLCSRLFLIADKDSFKEERHARLQKALGERFCLLPCKEIENLLAPDAVKTVVDSYEKEPLQLTSELQWDDYAQVPLGTFIEEKLLQRKRTRQGAYAAESGTVSDKVNFCDKAIKATKTFSDMSTGAQELADKVYKFIAHHNR